MKKNVAIPLDVLRSGDAKEAAKYGPQALDLDEVEQLNRDAIESAEHAEKNLYARNREAEYPPAGEQLDAIWKALAGMGLTGEAKEMLSRVEGVKAKHPKPEGK
jgi:hypothetical protein